MDLLSLLSGLFGGQKPVAAQAAKAGAKEAPRQALPMLQQLSQSGKLPNQNQDIPDITYNPDPNTNLPYSTHNLADVALGNEYSRDPTNPKFLGVDPSRFGYPADNTVVRPIVGNQPNLQGRQNPGYTSLQNSGYGPAGYTVGLQGAGSVQDGLLRQLQGGRPLY